MTGDSRTGRSGTRRAIVAAGPGRCHARRAPRRTRTSRDRVRGWYRSADSWTFPFSATWRSSPTSTTASPRWPTACSSCAARSIPATCGRSTSTRWTSSGSGASPSSSRACGSNHARPRHQPDRHAGPRRLRLRGVAVAGRLRGRRSCWSTRPRASRPRPWPTATSRSRTTSRSSRRSTRSTCRPPTPTGTPPRSSSVARHPGRRDPAHQRQDRRGRARAARRRRRADARRPWVIPTAPLQALIFDSLLRPVPRRGQLGPGDERRLRHAQQAALHAGRHGARGRRGRGALARQRAGRRRWAPARSATSSPASRTWARPARVRPSPPTCTATDDPLDGLPRAQADGVLRPLSHRRRRVRRPARVAREAAASTTPRSPTSPRRRGRSGFGFRCGFLGPAPHGDRARAARARVRPQPDRHRPVGGVPGAARPTGDEIEIDNPSEMPSSAEVDADRRALSAGHHHHARPSTPARSWTCARAGGARWQTMEYLSPERLELIYRLPLAEVVIDFFDQLKSRTQGYASLDYEAVGYERGRPGQGRHPAQRRAGRRLQHDRAPRRGPTSTGGAWPRS